MFDLSQITGFDWDEGHARKSVDRHDVSQAQAEQAFLNEPLILAEDATHSVEETRFRALGRTSANRLHVTFTLRQTLIRVISARAMNRKERAIYEGADHEEKEA